MSVLPQEKQKMIAGHALHTSDTGSVEVQVALLSQRILNLTAHLKKFPKDIHSRRGMTVMVSKRKRLLKYLKQSCYSRYQELINKLGLRK